MTLFDNPFDFLENDPSSLSGNERDNLIRNFLTADAFADTSQSQARQMFRDAGFRFRDSTFNSLFNEVVGVTALPRNLGRLGYNTVPNEGYLFDSTGKLPKRYRFTVSYSYLDEETGESVRKFMSVNSDDLLSVGSYLSTAEEYISNPDNTQYPQQVESLALVRGYVDRSF